MDLSMEIDEDEDINKLKKRKATKANRSKIDDAVVVASSGKRNIKRIILSVTKPSYTLKRGSGRDMRSLRWEHRNKLRYLLRQLIRRQNWDEASGVLSVLLKGTHRENSLSTNRTKYWTTLALLEHMGSAKTKTRKIHHLYEIWMKKNFAITKNRRWLKGRFDVQLEFLLYCLSQGDSDGAYQAVISFLQETDFTSDPIANLVAGLAFSHLWYNSIKKEMQLQDSLEPSTSIQSGMSGIDHSNGQCVVEVEDSDSAFERDSNTSIRIGKTIDGNRVVPMEVDYNVKKEMQYEELHLNSLESDQIDDSSQFPHTGNKRYGSIFYAHDLENFLMPLKFPSTKELGDFISFQKRIHTDHYKAAVKHLRGALHSTPPAFEALLPLIQMLLFGDQVKEAIEEVESVVQISDATLPFRLKASLQEHFSNEDATKLSACFEETLKKDPTCSHSISKLISFHHDGFYNTENLVEMIALHLDATYADCHIWREFASCFLRLSQCDEDRMSSCVGEGKDSSRKHSKNTPDMFKDNTSRKNWRIRCRWWLTRHFTQTILASEVSSGNVELLACKAASGCHLYGSEFAYVVKACTYLKKEKSREISILKMHVENAIGIYVA
ncbi:uncharacterized protein LOC111919979 isoform X1 [Lactuca sativa]|uniref:Uncharacterized protein n=2 Tax=Lactuca sativa TaxID=4236 RepID=A0A9R1VC69_LACSA|nr:uncharacterized protein LOC111919979 isoform X1 [Lactuca sativa]KAJ0203428.1 hypothetical protein LSAT_V11C500274880 [Lactuca sativa]